MSKNLRELQARKAKHVASMRAITDKAATDGRDLNDDEVVAFDAAKASAAAATVSIAREQDLIEQERSEKRQRFMESVTIGNTVKGTVKITATSSRRKRTSASGSATGRPILGSEAPYPVCSTVRISDSTSTKPAS